MSKFVNVAYPVSKRYGVVSGGGPSEYEVSLVPKKSIAVKRVGKYATSPIEFKVGDWAEYDSYNLTYVGKIVAISPKSVTIDVNAKYSWEKPKMKRLNLYEFSWRNYDFNLESIAAKNADTMMYI